MPPPPLSLNDLFSLHSRVTSLLDRAGIAHCHAGGLAVSVWGEPRTTFDVDLVVATAPGQVDQLLAALAADPQFSLAPNQFELTTLVTIVRAPIVAVPAETNHPEIVVMQMQSDSLDFDSVAGWAKTLGVEADWLNTRSKS